MEIQYLPKENWQGHIVPIGYTTSEIYEVAVTRSGDDFTVTLQKKPLARPVVHTPEQYNYPDRLYAEHWEGACAHGIVQDGELAAVIETCAEEWSNRLRVTELWVDAGVSKAGPWPCADRACQGAGRARKAARGHFRNAVMQHKCDRVLSARGLYAHWL